MYHYVRCARTLGKSHKQSWVLSVLTQLLGLVRFQGNRGSGELPPPTADISCCKYEATAVGGSLGVEGEVDALLLHLAKFLENVLSSRGGKGLVAVVDR